jgi:hypothetical protein
MVGGSIVGTIRRERMYASGPLLALGLLNTQEVAYGFSQFKDKVWPDANYRHTAHTDTYDRLWKPFLFLRTPFNEAPSGCDHGSIRSTSR